jgi:hypothetical protein
MNYFNQEAFVDGTGRGKSFHQVQSTTSEIPPEPSISLIKDPNKKKKHRTPLAIVTDEVVLPLPAVLEHRAPTFTPCAQFPKNYISTTSLDILHWSKYHGRNISFYLKDIGYFSTADRSDPTRCREDFRYLKRLLYDIDDLRQLRQMKFEFDLNIGSPYLNPAEPSTSIDSLLWWISQHKNTLLDHRGR